MIMFTKCTSLPTTVMMIFRMTWVVDGIIMMIMFT